MLPRLMVAFGAIALLNATLLAQTTSADVAAAAWSTLTTADVDAAHALQARNHPGAARAAMDTSFRRTLDDAARVARERARQVASYEGWLATLRGFATSFADPHIALQPRLSGTRFGWPGFIVGRRGSSVVVVARDTTATSAPPVGAEIVACDGVPIDRFAEERVGRFRGTWDVGSQRVQLTPWLLIEDGNPFLVPARECVIRGADASTSTSSLQWRNASACSPLGPGSTAARVSRPTAGASRSSPCDRAALFAMNLDGSSLTRLTSDSSTSYEMEWSPDSRQIAFYSDRNGDFELYVMNADGSGQRQLTGLPIALEASRLDALNSRVTDGRYRGRQAVRTIEREGPVDTSVAGGHALALVRGIDFSQGTIEVDIAGAPRAARTRRCAASSASRSMRRRTPGTFARSISGRPTAGHRTSCAATTRRSISRRRTIPGSDCAAYFANLRVSPRSQ